MHEIRPETKTQANGFELCGGGGGGGVPRTALTFLCFLSRYYSYAYLKYDN